jgi:hypothetical protein
MQQSNIGRTAGVICALSIDSPPVRQVEVSSQIQPARAADCTPNRVQPNSMSTLTPQGQLRISDSRVEHGNTSSISPELDNRIDPGTVSTP